MAGVGSRPAPSMPGLVGSSESHPERPGRGKLMVAVDPQVEAVLSRITREDLLEVALALGNIESPTGYEGPACDYAYDWMQREGFRPERVGAFDARYHVVGRLPGTGGGPSLAFNS